MPVLGIAFDMDGVLTQSMERHYEAYKRTFADIGVAIQPHEVYAREGQSAPEVIAFIARERKVDIPSHKVDAMVKQKQETFASFGPQPLYPGARELITTLAQARVPIALVTGTFKENAHRHLGDLIPRFRTVVSSEMVKKTKPDPEPYRRAFDALQVDPEDGVVIENAVLGIKSGKAAGATVVGLTTTLPARELKGADVIFSNLTEVREWLRQQGVPC